jgi:uncharacterized protein (DUF362 family)
MDSSRRSFMQMAGMGLLWAARPLKAGQGGRTFPPPVQIPVGKARVSLVQGDNRRKNVYDAMVAIDNDIRAKLKTRKRVIIKPNDTSTVNQLASTHVDTLRGILDYLAPRYKGEVVIAEAASGVTWEGYDNFKYAAVIPEYRSLNVKLVDLNEEARYEVISLIDRDLHAMPIRVAARLLDPDAFVICAAINKSHDTAVATMAVKNMAQGAPLRSAPKETPTWSDKKRLHSGIRQINCNLLTSARRSAPSWGVAVIDSFEGMEGDGPVSGNPVPHRIASASTDFVAADRVGLETMGIDPTWVGYLQFCAQFGVGQYDLSKIEVIGTPIAAVTRKYRLHQTIEHQLEWRGPLNT